MINSESIHRSLSGLDSGCTNIQFRAKAIFENPGYNCVFLNVDKSMCSFDPLKIALSEKLLVHCSQWPQLDLCNSSSDLRCLRLSWKAISSYLTLPRMGEVDQMTLDYGTNMEPS